MLAAILLGAACTSFAAATADVAVKKSRNGICHERGTAGYEQTVHFKAFDSLAACQKSGGRLPKNSGRARSHFDSNKPAHPGDEGVLFGPLVKVIDGDTLKVKIQGAELKVRLIGIDAPESDQPFGDAARDELASLVGDETCVLVYDEGDNPFEQARRYTFDLNEQIQRDGRLVHPAGHAYQGKSIVPFGCGVVFPNITRRQFAQTDLHEVFPENRCVFKDEMTEGADPEAFRERLWRMVATRFGPPLTLPEFDRLRALLFPEIRIRQIGLPLARAAISRADEMLAVMDLHQEQVARGLGEGHRIIRGVAGSGKTLILAFRAEYLARASNKPVLILCNANGIAGRLEDVMQERGVEDRVQVRTFHSWCYQMLRTYGIPQPSEAEYPDYNERLAACVRTVDAEVRLGHIPGGQYDAVLIDEAHDFEPEWLSLAVKMVNPNTKAFLIAYDDMQAIYKGMGRPVWSQLGIEAKGRTRVLKVNYRNTAARSHRSPALAGISRYTEIGSQITRSSANNSRHIGNNCRAYENQLFPV